MKAARSLGLALLAAACSAAPKPNAGASSQPARRSVSSNVLRSDYIGSSACTDCHRKQAAAFEHSPMHRMTRDVHTAEVRAPFDAEFSFKADRAHMEQHEGERFVRVVSGRGDETLFRVTKVIGGRYREDFVGERVATDAPLAPALGEQRILPVSYLIFEGSWRYKGYSVLLPERPALEPGVIWQRACIFCHNTAPALSSLFDNLKGTGASAYQGSVSDELPPERDVRLVVDDEAKLRGALGQELGYLGAATADGESTDSELGRAIEQTRLRFGEKHLVELGIGCETCHGGSRAHAHAPSTVKPSFAFESDFMHVTRADGQEPERAEQINRRCAQCHTVLFSRYPYTWEGGTRRAHPGGSSINSGEARDFLLGGCASALACTSCHDPHGEDDRARLAELAGPRGNEICTNCHRELAAPAALQAHSHHQDGSAGSFCLNCHMPKKNMGLAYELTRYHRIGSPTDEERVQGDRPLECALCHSDKSVEQLVLTMEKLWNKRYDRDKLERLYGRDLKQNAILLTLLGGKPHEVAVAMDVAARDGLPRTVPLIVQGLENDYPLVRYFARHSLEKRFGQRIDLPMSESGPAIVSAAEQWLKNNGREKEASAP